MSFLELGLKAISGNAFSYEASLDESMPDASMRLERNELQRVYEATKAAQVYHSNKIEGNRLSYNETAIMITGGAELAAKPPIDQLEARNLARALDFAFDTALDHHRAFTQMTLRQLHALIVADIEDDAGEYRRTQNYISGSPHTTPDPFLVPQFMSALSDTISCATDPGELSDKSLIAFAAAIHALFLQIHPFTDGNGRTARALLNMMLMRRNYAPCIIKADDRDCYIETLQDAWHGDISSLIALIHASIVARHERGNLV